MTAPLMPKATAVWLVDNTTLTFHQIAKFCEIHELEIQATADGDIAYNIQGLSPINNGQLSWEEIKRCEADPKASLKLNESDLPALSIRSKGARYTPMAKRQDKPDAIAWILKHHPELTDAQIRKLLGTTNNSIDAIRNRTHWNMANIKARNPVLLGLCTEIDLKKAVEVAPKSLTGEAAPLDVEDAEE